MMVQGQARPPVKILFLGQCLQYGYESVSRDSTFPTLVYSMLRTRFPGLSFRVDQKYLYHPTGLKPILKHRLLLTRPDIVVISLPAMFAATYWRVNLIYQIAPELVDTARSFVRKLSDRVKKETGAPTAETLIDKTFTRHPPLAVEDYERIVEDAIKFCRNISDCRPVLMGPGRFNEDTIENYAIHSPALWASVNQMVLRVGERLNVPVINAQETLADYGGEVFLPNNHRWSHYGHEIVAREVEHVLASEISGIGAGKI